MRHVALALVVLVIGCSAPPVTVSPTSTAAHPAVAEGTPYPGEGSDIPICPPGLAPVYIRELAPRGGRMCIVPQGPPAPELVSSPEQRPVILYPPQLQMPEVALRTGPFTSTAVPAPRRGGESELPPYVIDQFGMTLMQKLDEYRGNGQVPLEYLEQPGAWDSWIWPGPFQQLARAVVGAHPRYGRAFHLDSARVDATYLLPWGGFQLMDATISFTDRAVAPPSVGDLSYMWHVRLPMSGPNVFVIADGYDANGPGLMRRDPYWTRSQLDAEAASAIAGYLWNESYVNGGGRQFPREQDTTPFWRERLAAVRNLNQLFESGVLTDRYFENVGVRIERFEPLTVFGAGIVTVTVSGRVVELVRGKRYTETFSQPMKFFRFGLGGPGISGWAAVDAFQDGEWVSGGDLALGTLQTAHG